MPSVKKFYKISSNIMDRENYVDADAAKQAEEEPVMWKPGWESRWGQLWLFKGSIYKVDQACTDEEVRLLILEDFDKERRLFEKLKAKFDSTKDSEPSYKRLRIPESVRVEVWRRDGGKCAVCGSREKLEYDHIVPVSKGGSNTTRNIELLCEKHNRAKSNNVV